MGTKNNPSTFDCYANAEPDEPMFILLARDRTASFLVEAWAMQRSQAIDRGEKPESDRAMVKEAYACAEAMRVWWEQNRLPLTKASTPA